MPKNAAEGSSANPKSTERIVGTVNHSTDGANLLDWSRGAAPAHGLDEKAQRLTPFGGQFRRTVEVRQGLRVPGLQQQGQAPPAVGHEVAGVDAEVLAAVLEDIAVLLRYALMGWFKCERQ